MSSEVQNKVSVAPRKGLMSSKELKKKSLKEHISRDFASVEMIINKKGFKFMRK